MNYLDLPTCRAEKSRAGSVENVHDMRKPSAKREEGKRKLNLHTETICSREEL